MSDEQLNTIVECCECEWAGLGGQLEFCRSQDDYVCPTCGGSHVVEVNCS